MAKDNNNSKIYDLSQTLSEKMTEIELLQQTFTSVGSELDLDKVFSLVSTRARELIDAETLLIPLLDENAETYSYRGGAGTNSEEIVGESFPLDYGVCGWVWKHKRPWWQGVLSELAEDEKNRWENEAGNLILVPLVGRRQFLGGIAGINKRNGEAFSKKDLHLLQMFASIVSIAIENAMAVKAIEDSNRLNEDYRRQLENLNKQLVESTRELEYLSLYDSVTALPNRSLFYDRLQRDLQSAETVHSALAILMIDIDNFKDINESLGHDTGDRLLNSLARRFESLISSNETLARLGGDEFIVVLPAHDEQLAVSRAQGFIDILHEPFNIKAHHLVVSASIGVVVYPSHGENISTLLSHVDFAMYQAKSGNSGANTSNTKICVYQHEDNHLAQGHLALVAEVRKALEKKQFELYYQPKIRAATGEVVSVEALARWKSLSRGAVSPSIFIRVLEQNGLIDEFTYWAIETALTQARSWLSEGRKVPVAVNLSPQTMMNPQFRTNIDRIVRRRADGELLIFEITENLFLSEYDRLADTLEHICALGIELSIDDYGTGYSSLSRLRRLPVSEIKIDQSFIFDMVDNKDDRAVVHSTIELAHNLGLRVVAEGVETQAVYELLVELGCDIIQGYFISEPVPVDEFNVLMSERADDHPPG